MMWYRDKRVTGGTYFRGSVTLHIGLVPSPRFAKNILEGIKGPSQCLDAVDKLVSPLLSHTLNLLSFFSTTVLHYRLLTQPTSFSYISFLFSVPVNTDATATHYSNFSTTRRRVQSTNRPPKKPHAASSAGYSVPDGVTDDAPRDALQGHARIGAKAITRRTSHPAPLRNQCLVKTGGPLG